MPSAKILDAKKKAVDELSEKVKSATSGVIVNYYKTTVADDTKLRRELREAGVEYGVVKNTALRFVFNNAGLEDLNDKLEGMTALAISSDAVAPAKILAKFGETHQDFEIKAGFLDGKVISAEEVAELSKIPSREALLTGLASALIGTVRKLACGLQAVADKMGEGETAEAPAEAEAAPAAEAPAEAPAAEAAAEAPAAE